MNNCKLTGNVNSFFVPLFTAIVTAVYIVLAGRIAMRGGMSVGLFLTNLDVYKKMSQGWNNVYDNLLVLNQSLPSMEHVTRYLNLPIDLEERRQANVRRREIQKEERQKARAAMQKEKLKNKG